MDPQQELEAQRADMSGAQNEASDGSAQHSALDPRQRAEMMGVPFEQGQEKQRPGIEMSYDHQAGWNIEGVEGANGLQGMEIGEEITREDIDLEASTGIMSREGQFSNYDFTHIERQHAKRTGENTAVVTMEGVDRTTFLRGKDNEGFRNVGVERSHTMYGQRLRHSFDNGMQGWADYDVGKVGAGARLGMLKEDGKFKIKGNANAEAVLVNGDARIVVPTFEWNMMGERVDVQVWAGVNAKVLAEAKGDLQLDIERGENLNLMLGGGGEVFAGAKAGVEVGAKVRWKRQDQASYIKLLKEFATSLPGSLDDWAVSKIPESAWPKIAKKVVGERVSNVLYASAGVEGSAGIGASARFAAGFEGGKISFQGNLNGTLGLGGGVKTRLELDALNGMRLMLTLLMRGRTWILDQIRGVSSMIDQLVDEVQKEVDNWMEANKKKGGLRGAFAGVMDFFGDSVFDLW